MFLLILRKILYEIDSMQFSKKATSLVEAMIIMTIVSLWVAGVYDFFITSERLAENTSQRIKAIQVAREWIEAVTNIRNTNWLLYGWDYQNCWNVQGYDIKCISDPGDTYDITPISYIVNQDVDNRWHLDWVTTWETYFQWSYRTDFWVEITAEWFYDQRVTGYPNPEFTREIIISYPEDTNWDGTNDSNDEKMFVRSLVQWGVNSPPHKVELSTTLTNWKNKN